MFKKLILTLLIACAVNSNLTWSQTTRGVSGAITLDVTPSDKNRVIEVTVNNHSFVVIPPFTIIRPITSSQSTRVTLTAGESTINYFIDGIIDDPVDYTIELNCIGCSSDFPRQYYSPDGNKFGLANSTYIDPDDLPVVLNLTAITRASITGEIYLNNISDRDLLFTVTVFSAQNPQQNFKTKSAITLPAGSLNTAYTISGLSRAIGSDQYGIRLQCTNCYGKSRQPQNFSKTLSADENHSDIDFSVTDIARIVITPILDLLLQ